MSGDDRPPQGRPGDPAADPAEIDEVRARLHVLQHRVAINNELLDAVRPRVVVRAALRVDEHLRRAWRRRRSGSHSDGPARSAATSPRAATTDARAARPATATPERAASPERLAHDVLLAAELASVEELVTTLAHQQEQLAALTRHAIPRAAARLDVGLHLTSRWTARPARRGPARAAHANHPGPHHGSHLVPHHGSPARHELDRDPHRAPPGRHDPSGARRSAPLRFSIITAVPERRLGPRWGDWHVAEGLGRALQQDGHDVGIYALPERHEPSAAAGDVRIVLRGQRRVGRSAGQPHVLWIISHPESVTVEECDDADLLLVASRRFAARLRTMTTTPVEVLLQATDPHRFRPTPPDAEHRHAVAIVANARHRLRPVVADALSAGLRPAIYGNGWDDLVDPRLIVARHIPNHLLPTIYSSVGVLLNDHWPTMRAWGFVSNRIYDALACDAAIVSDDLPELAELFPGALETYEHPGDLAERVAHLLADEPAARARAMAGRQAILASHTFEDRAGEVIAALLRHGILPARRR